MSRSTHSPGYSFFDSKGSNKFRQGAQIPRILHGTALTYNADYQLRRVMETFDVEEKSLTYLEQLYPNVKVRQDVLLSLDTNTRVRSLLLMTTATVKPKARLLFAGGSLEKQTEGVIQVPVPLSWRSTSGVQCDSFACPKDHF